MFKIENLKKHQLKFQIYLLRQQLNLLLCKQSQTLDCG